MQWLVKFSPLEAKLALVAATERGVPLRQCMAEIAVSRAFNLSWTGHHVGNGSASITGGIVAVQCPPKGELQAITARAEDRQPCAADYPIVLARVEDGDPLLGPIEVELLGWAFHGDVMEYGKKQDGLYTLANPRVIEELQGWFLEWSWSTH